MNTSSSWIRENGSLRLEDYYVLIAYSDVNLDIEDELNVLKTSRFYFFHL